MTNALHSLDTVALQQAATLFFQIAGICAALLVLGYLGSLLLGRTGPHPVAGIWRRDIRGRALCPACIAVPDPEDDYPLLPADAGAPVEPGEKCACCLAYRAAAEMETSR